MYCSPPHAYSRVEERRAFHAVLAGSVPFFQSDRTETANSMVSNTEKAGKNLRRGTMVANEAADIPRCLPHLKVCGRSGAPHNRWKFILVFLQFHLMLLSHCGSADSVSAWGFSHSSESSVFIRLRKKTTGVSPWDFIFAAACIREFQEILFARCGVLPSALRKSFLSRKGFFLRRSL